MCIRDRDERKQYIDKSLLAAREANEQLANIKADSEMILAKAHEEQARIPVSYTHLFDKKH